MRKATIEKLINVNEKAIELRDALYEVGIMHFSVDLAENRRDVDTFEEITAAVSKMEESLKHMHKALQNSVSFYEKIIRNEL